MLSGERNPQVVEDEGKPQDELSQLSIAVGLAEGIRHSRRVSLRRDQQQSASVLHRGGSGLAGNLSKTILQAQPIDLRITFSEDAADREEPFAPPAECFLAGLSTFLPLFPWEGISAVECCLQTHSQISFFLESSYSL